MRDEAVPEDCIKFATQKLLVRYHTLRFPVDEMHHVHFFLLSTAHPGACTSVFMMTLMFLCCTGWGFAPTFADMIMRASLLWESFTQFLTTISMR